jgi:hypothetical protein
LFKPYNLDPEGFRVRLENSRKTRDKHKYYLKLAQEENKKIRKIMRSENVSPEQKLLRIIFRNFE